MDYELDFIKSLILTILSETFILLLFFHWILNKKHQANIYAVLLVGIISTTLTLPYVWFILPRFFPDKTTFILISETLVIIIESLIYIKFIKCRYSLLLLASFLSNTFSFLLGYFIF